MYDCWSRLICSVIIFDDTIAGKCIWQMLVIDTPSRFGVLVHRTPITCMLETHSRGDSQKSHLELVNVVFIVAKHFFNSSNFHIVGDWRVKKYKCFEATLMKSTTFMVYIDCPPPGYWVNTNILYDVIFWETHPLFLPLRWCANA